MKLFYCLLIGIIFNIYCIYAGDTIRLDSMDVITLLADKPFIVNDSLTITVSMITSVMYAPDKRTVTEFSLEIKTSEKTERLNVTSDEPHIVWEDYEFDYVGGGAYDVKLKIKKIKNEH